MSFSVLLPSLLAILLFISVFDKIERLSMTLRQTAKMKLLPSVFSSMYSRVQIFLFAVNSRRHLSISVRLIQGLREENKKSEVIFAVCRLP